MNKHTPGPWIADEFFMEEDRCVRVGTNDGTSDYYHRSATICECWVKNSADDDDVLVPELSRAEANARLIAAAPELLEALRQMIDVMMDCEFGTPAHAKAEREARAAIVKATGAKP